MTANTYASGALLIACGFRFIQGKRRGLARLESRAFHYADVSVRSIMRRTVDTELQGTDEVIQSQGWERNPHGGWTYVAGEGKTSLAHKKRVRHIAKLMGISLQAAMEYCESLDA